MERVFVSYNNIISPLGFDTGSNVENIAKDISGIQLHENPAILPKPFYSSIVDKPLLNDEFRTIGNTVDFTFLEKMMILSLNDVIRNSGLEITSKTGVIISTTKGNIDVLDVDSEFPKNRAYLHELGRQIQQFFGFKTEPIIVSNACVSGILAVAIAKRLIQVNSYDDIFIVSGDLVSEFILSGFSSFQAISENPCKPFSAERDGITIGEAAASILVTKNGKYLSQDALQIIGDGSSNDANHISGPSRTAEGLVNSISSALDEAKMTDNEIDYISAHGTATLYNDEMEAIALNRVGLEKTPVNSLKGFYGHTLGASGLVETIIGMQSLFHNELYTSKGFNSLGVSQPINVIQQKKKSTLNTFLKTASGFGGCNTAVIFKKND